MPLGTKVRLGPCHIVLDGDPAPPKGAQQPPSFRPMSIVATVAHLNPNGKGPQRPRGHAAWSVRMGRVIFGGRCSPYTDCIGQGNEFELIPG